MYAIDISNPANPRGHRLDHREHAARERHHDDARRQVPRLHARGRGRPEERHRHLLARGSAAPEADRRVHRGRHGRRALGVHLQQAKYGTHVYLTNDGTGALHVIDINDPYHPKEVAQWKTPRADAGRSLHDIDLQDGLLYASYWNDGLVILDVGNGMKGGIPSNPQLVSQYKYDLNDLYRQVGARGGARLHPRHAHGVAAQELRLHRRRGVPGERREGREGRGGRPRVRAAAGDRRERHREAEVGRVLRAGVRRRA